jgi:hypothetical protein
MQVMKYPRASTLALTVATALLLSAPDALADETFIVATSKAHMLHVTADGGAEWCTPNVRLRLVLEAGSPDAGKPDAQIEIMNRLRTAIELACKSATAAEITVTGPGAAPGTFAATATGNWRFAAISPGSATATPVAKEPQAASVPSLAPATPPARLPQLAEKKPDPGPVLTSAPRQAPTPLPLDHDYASTVLAYVKNTPALADDENILKLWASYRYQQQYQQVWNQEFKLRQLLEQARTNLVDTISRAEGNLVTITLSSGFGEYDFKTHRFPIALNANQVTERSQLFSPAVASPIFVINVTDFDFINELPMDAAAAQAFVEKRTRYGNVDRRILLAATIRLNAPGFAKDNWGNLVAGGRLESATIFDDMNGQQPIYQISAAELEKLRAGKAAKVIAEKQQEAEQQYKMRLERDKAERAQNIATLANSTVATRLANWISTDPLNFSISLDALRWARARSVLNGGPVSVAMLVQMGASGRKAVETKWPDHLQVTVDDSAAELKSSGWYLVAGQLTVPQGDAPAATQLSATAVYACGRPQCAEATDAAAIVDRKTAGRAKLQ